MVNAPLKVPVLVGLKTMLVVQLAPAAKVVPQPKEEIAKGVDTPAHPTHPSRGRIRNPPVACSNQPES